MYHRVVKDDQINEDLEYGLTVSTSNFERQIKAIKTRYEICSIDKFIENLKRKKNKFMVSITFDDGYKDNLYHALPILEKYEVPASIYITTRFLNKDVDMWWYELGNIIQKKTELSFDHDNKKFYFLLKNKNQKMVAYQNLKKIFLGLKIDKQNKLMEKITNSKKRENYSHICLNSDEIKTLERHPLITIGSHSHNHLNLKILNEDEIKYEISKSLEILQSLVNYKIKHFCYPFGGENQASQREFNIVEKFKFNSAVTGRVFPIKGNNFFSLPRIYIGKNTSEKILLNHLSGP